MVITPELRRLVDQMPDADDRDMYNQNIDKTTIEQAVAKIGEGGRDDVVGLIEMLGMPGSERNTKPRYALRCLANYVLANKDEAARKVLSEVLATSLLSDRSKQVKRLICEELQWAGGEEAVTALGSLLLDDQLVESATMALLAIRQGAAEQFRDALLTAEGKCRLNIVQALGDLRDSASAGNLKLAMQDPDREVRLAAGWGLARMGDVSSVASLINEADSRDGWERIQATKHCLMLAEQLSSLGKKDVADQIYTHLRDTRRDPAEKHVREAAERGLRVESK